MAKSLLLVGYFGRGNLGDDAILMGFVNGIKDLPYDVKVVCGEPSRLNMNFGLRGVQHRDFAAIKTEIAACDAVVFPGGSIFQDVTSLKSVGYYQEIVRLAKKDNKPVIMLGQGVGPLNRFLGKRMAASAFNAADVVVVRDPASQRALAELGVKTECHLAADMAFLLPEPLADDSTTFGVGDMKAVGLSARPYGKDKGKSVMKLFAEVAKLLYSNNYVPVLIEMDREHDAKILDGIAKAQGGRVPEIRKLQHPADLQRRIGRMEAIIGMRLHAGVLAATMGVPSYMISYDPKVQAFTTMMGFAAPPKVENVTADKLFAGFQSMMSSRDRVVETMNRRKAEAVQKAEINIEVLTSAIGQ